MTPEAVIQRDASDRQAPVAEPPRPQLSLLRLALLLSVLAAFAGTAVLLIDRHSSAAAGSSSVGPSFSPYVDVTLTPTYAFQDPAAAPVGGVFLGFIVAQAASPCSPSWGGFYTLGAAETTLNLDERIAQAQAQGAHPMISFGGQANNELAVACSRVAALTAAYLAPVQRYHTRVIDLDIEGSSLTNHAANDRRALAIAAAQRQRAAAHAPLGVWLTLPVATNGLTADGLAAIRAMLAAHVALTGVNVLAMDFGPREADMIGPVQSAVNTADQQLRLIYRQAQGSAESVSHQLGVTVMIGQNDVAGERFTITDARRLNAFASRIHLARVSMWSLNRDSECGSAFAQVGVLSNTCSGVTQTPLEFTHIFSRLAGTVTAKSQVAPASPVAWVGRAPVDNPAASPDPIWQPTAMYIAGYKVTWHQSIYQAKWFSQGLAPDAPAQGTAQTPWLLIGPVPPGTRAPKPVLFDSAKHPTWSTTAIYREGARVVFSGLPFEAKYYTSGDQPSSALPADPQSPWRPLFTMPGEPDDRSIGAS